jgi:hypothetical protein
MSLNRLNEDWQGKIINKGSGVSRAMDDDDGVAWAK